MNKIIFADALKGLALLESNSIDACITSPPYYGLRDYGTTGQIGLENSPQEYIDRLVRVFHEVHRVLKSDGTLSGLRQTGALSLTIKASAVCGGRAPRMIRFMCITLLCRVVLTRMCLTPYGSVQVHTKP